MIGYILSMKFKKCMLFFGFFILIALSVYQFQINTAKYYSAEQIDKKFIPNILWWTPFSYQNDLHTIHCGEFTCAITDNRKFIDNISVFLFYGSNFIYSDLPLPRKSNDIWALLHEESPKNIALFLDEDGLNIFNISSTFSRYSHYPITLQYLSNISVLTDTSHFLQVNKKNELLKNLSPIIYIQSDCETPMNRDSYVLELMKYINVDSYGACINNKKLPENLTKNPLENLFSNEFLNFVSQYKFTIAFENAVCDDYITEKLWRPLIVGSVPIYMGSPSVQDWLPNNNSAIIADKFGSPKQLADYIKKVNSNDTLYEEFLHHKINGTISNKLLLNTMHSRTWNENYSYISSYECFICEHIHKKTKFKSVSTKHYDCPKPISPVTKTVNSSNWWNYHWQEGKCGAKVLKKYILSNKNLSNDIFQNETNKLLNSNEC